MRHGDPTDEEKIEIENYLSLSTNDLLLLISVFDKEYSYIGHDADLESISSLKLVDEVICRNGKLSTIHFLNIYNLIVKIKYCILDSGVKIRTPILLLATTIAKVGLSKFCECD